MVGVACRLQIYTLGSILVLPMGQFAQPIFKSCHAYDMTPDTSPFTIALVELCTRNRAHVANRNSQSISFGLVVG